MTPKRAESIERALSMLLDALAVALIPLDVTPIRLEQLARASFVRAGAANARKRSSGKPHIARIAAQTGLSRSEVKRIVDANFHPGVRDAESWPRALRVLKAWTEIASYSTKAKPRRLRIAGRSPSFSTLCRSHSGDIPYQVILSELRSRGRVRISRDNLHVSIAKKNVAPAREATMEQTLSFAANFLSAALNEELVLLKRRQTIPAPNSVPLAYAETAISGRVTELLDQIPKLFPEKSKNKQNMISVYALVARGQRTSKE